MSVPSRMVLNSVAPGSAPAWVPGEAASASLVRDVLFISIAACWLRGRPKSETIEGRVKNVHMTSGMGQAVPIQRCGPAPTFARLIADAKVA